MEHAKKLTRLATIALAVNTAVWTVKLVFKIILFLNNSIEFYNLLCEVKNTKINRITFVDPCNPTSCNNSGICSRDGKGGYTCDCNSTGYKGDNCNENSIY